MGIPVRGPSNRPGNDFGDFVPRSTSMAEIMCLWLPEWRLRTQGEADVCDSGGSQKDITAAHRLTARRSAPPPVSGVHRQGITRTR